jgi:hypothetical protein
MHQKTKKHSELMLATLNEILSFKHFKTDVEHCFKILEESPHPDWLYYNHRHVGEPIPPYLIVETNHSFECYCYQHKVNDTPLLCFNVFLYDKILWATELETDMRGTIDFEFDPKQTSLNISCRHWTPTMPFHCKTTTFKYVMLPSNFYEKLLGLFSELKVLTDATNKDEFISSEQVSAENITSRFKAPHKEDEQTLKC